MPRVRANGTARGEPGTGDLAADRERELQDTADWLEAYATASADDLHPDRIGVRRAPEPKSLYAEVRGRTGSIAKPKSASGKITEVQPYSYSRRGLGRWQQRG